MIERRVLTCEVQVDNVPDLRPQQALTTVELADGELFSEPGEYDRCQAIGAAANQLGRHGVIALSASRLGETLALFSTNLPVEQWPTVKACDIWQGLPPDPRVLRVVEDTA